MATPNQDGGIQAKVSTAKKVLAGANAFEKSADPTGALKPKPITTTSPTPAAPKAPTLADELRYKRQNVEQYHNALPKMHTGGVVPKDGDYTLKKGEKVIPASGRQSEYREAFEERGRQGLHKYGQSAKQVTRQVGGNTPVKGEEHVKGEKKVAVPNKD